ncbi:hypothetical protein PPSIR1_16070 [Plesiocystis pacifica SIR-1]|uniref:Uncharacterized protein n=1 Tax=Plesiocystis pacifica SIR-1 TaxID=391625 RepID=A6GAU2_9BACT|nr:hypothetical protein [Plesiocystis pacifica]EDM77033.1 hypothetical protein PPSIR1_16070 [Plesiocystis pacifica SIR-1]
MSELMSPLSVDAFVEALIELDLEPESLRRDPAGASWLPASLREAAERSPECARELEEFVEMELALCDVHEPVDAFFTRQVMDRLPELDAVDHRRRTWILASAYALAIGVTYLLLGPLLSSGELAAMVEPVRDWYGSGAAESGGVWMGAVALIAAVAIGFLPAGGRPRAEA